MCLGRPYGRPISFLDDRTVFLKKFSKHIVSTYQLWLVYDRLQIIGDVSDDDGKYGQSQKQIRQMILIQIQIKFSNISFVEENQ